MKRLFPLSLMLSVMVVEIGLSSAQTNSHRPPSAVEVCMLANDATKAHGYAESLRDCSKSVLASNEKTSETLSRILLPPPASISISGPALEIAGISQGKVSSNMVSTIAPVIAPMPKAMPIPLGSGELKDRCLLLPPEDRSDTTKRSEARPTKWACPKGMSQPSPNAHHGKSGASEAEFRKQCEQGNARRAKNSAPASVCEFPKTELFSVSR